MTVAEHLQASRSAHDAYRRAAGRIDRDGKVTDQPNYESCSVSIRTALTERMAAEAADPTHEDPAWHDDRVPSSQLTGFYREYLGE